jgi:hypothetical protein
MCIACIFIPIGIALQIQAAGIFESVIVYDSADPANVNCRITQENTGYASIVAGAPMACNVTFTLTQDITTPLNLYYQLTNFYQNHRRYVKSRSDDQCGGKYVAPMSTALQTSCDPDASWLANVTAPNGTNKLAYYPCGLIATSFFNDRIDLRTGPAGSFVDETNIAWPVDLQYKFLNPNSQSINKWNEFLYLWQTYDQMSEFYVVVLMFFVCVARTPKLTTHFFL